MAEITTDVLIIGTGPAGCSCAALLSSYGIDNMVVNRYRWLATTPRAHITNQRTMEVLRDLGHDVEAKKEQQKKLLERRDAHLRRVHVPGQALDHHLNLPLHRHEASK